MMVCPASFLALWILTSAPAGSATATDRPNSAVILATFQGENLFRKKQTEKDSKAPMPPPRRLPRDPAYDGKELPPALNKEGIPGLPLLTPNKQNVPVPPPAPKHPSPEWVPAPPRAPQPPKEAAKYQDYVGEAFCTDNGVLCDPRGGECLRCGVRNRLRGWFDGICTESWLDQGVTLNTLSPRNRVNGPVTFNDRSNDYQLNQFYFRLKRDVDRDGDFWDLGGRIDFLYGTDSIYTSARGLEVFDDFSPKWNAQRYGLAMPQLYMEAYVPWGNGLSVKLGHFYSILGYETVTAPDNFFYSHSYVRQYAEPFTYTGFLGATRLGQFTLQAGMTRGFDNWEDNNNDLGFVGGVGWTSRNRRTSIALAVDAAREQPDPSSNIRTVYSLVIQQELGDRWQYVIQHDYGNEPGAGVGGTIANWYGVNQYLFYTISDRWKAGLRFEWFRDENGSRVPGADRTADYYELCPGVNWTPNQRLIVRSELRWDWTGTANYYPFGDGTRSNQLLLACDVIVRF